MKLARESARVISIDGTPLETALLRTTHLGVGAHADDLEIMASHAILECLGRSDRAFSGVIVTDGAGGPRAAPYAHLSEQEMAQVRAAEQLEAARLGEYAALVMLGYPSQNIKEPGWGVVEDLRTVLHETLPEVVYTHNLADKHDTHVAVALRLIEACRALPEGERPKRVLGCEVWRDLDWLCAGDQLRLRVEDNEALIAQLVGAHASQLAGGKRYDLAVLGRQRAHATFAESHAADGVKGLAFAMDLTPLIHDPARSPADHARELVERFQRDVLARILRLSAKS